MFHIRKAKIGDSANIIKLLMKLGRPKPKRAKTRYFANLIKRYIADSDKTIFVAEKNSEIIGMVSLIFLLRLNQIKQEAWMPDLIVAKEYQKQGAGTILLNKCLDVAKKKNCYRIRLESGLSRKATHEFYKNLNIKPFALSFEKKIPYSNQTPKKGMEDKL